MIGRWDAHVASCRAHEALNVPVLCMQALDAHAEAAEECGSMEAREALLATLQCLHALLSGAAGMRGMLEVGSMRCPIMKLATAQEASRFAPAHRKHAAGHLIASSCRSRSSGTQLGPKSNDVCSSQQPD